LATFLLKSERCLDWYEEGAEAGKCKTNTQKFAGNFLAGMKGDYALIPCPYQ